MYMMTFRVGVDIVSINRFEEDVLLSQSFLDRCFTSTEQRYCFSQSRPSQHFAVRVAGKEAVRRISACARAQDLHSPARV